MTDIDRPKVLLFDLGGVIVRWTGIEGLCKLTGLTRAEILTKFETTEAFRAYEIGKCSDTEFINALISAFDLDFTPLQAKHLWQRWVEATYEGTKDALSKLSENYVVACLSNTNALHWDWLTVHIDLEQYFQYRYASHLIGAAKPNAASYQIPLEDMKVKAEDVWFFDDTQANIDAAQALGISAHLVDREVGVIPTLKRLNLL